jgi:hypothetical protein
MIDRMDFRIVDIVLFVIANLVNLLVPIFSTCLQCGIHSQ